MCGCDDFLTKPIDSSRLYRTLAKWVLPGATVIRNPEALQEYLERYSEISDDPEQFMEYDISGKNLDLPNDLDVGQTLPDAGSG